MEKMWAKKRPKVSKPPMSPSQSPIVDPIDENVKGFIREARELKRDLNHLKRISSSSRERRVTSKRANSSSRLQSDRNEMRQKTLNREHMLDDSLKRDHNSSVVSQMRSTVGFESFERKRYFAFDQQ